MFTKNSPEALNLGPRPRLGAVPCRVGPGDEIVITEMEHHSNIVPWQLLAERTGAKLRWFGITDGGRLDLSNIDDLITERTKVVAFVYVSNILGTINPVVQIAQRAREVGALSVVDASQAVPQLPVDVVTLGADFVAFTGHKMCGPTGIGALWGRREVLEELPPFLGGGEMIADVRMSGSTYAALPHKYEAGTPPIAQAVGLGAAVDYLSALGMDAVAAHEQAITSYALERLGEIDGLTIVGPDSMVDRGEQCRSLSVCCIRMTLGRSLTSRASPSAWGTIARSRCARASVCRRQRAPRSMCTRRLTMSTRSCRGCSG